MLRRHFAAWWPPHGRAEVTGRGWAEHKLSNVDRLLPADEAASASSPGYPGAAGVGSTGCEQDQEAVRNAEVCDAATARVHVAHTRQPGGGCHEKRRRGVVTPTELLGK